MEIQEYIPVIYKYFESNNVDKDDILFKMFDGCHCNLKAIADDILFNRENVNRKHSRIHAFALGIIILYVRGHKESDFKELVKCPQYFIVDKISDIAKRKNFAIIGKILLPFFDKNSTYHVVGNCHFIISTDSAKGKQQIQQLQMDHQQYKEKIYCRTDPQNTLTEDEKVFFSKNNSFTGWLVLNNRIESLKLACPYAEMFYMYQFLDQTFKRWSLLQIALNPVFQTDTFESFKVLYSKGIRLMIPLSSNHRYSLFDGDSLDDCDGNIPYWIIKKKHVQMLAWYINERKKDDPSYATKLVEGLQQKYLNLAISDENPSSDLIQYLQRIL